MGGARGSVTHLNEAGGTFLSRQREVEVQMGGGCSLVGRSFQLLSLTLTVAVLLCEILRTCTHTGHKRTIAHENGCNHIKDPSQKVQPVPVTAIGVCFTSNYIFFNYLLSNLRQFQSKNIRRFWIRTVKEDMKH